MLFQLRSGSRVDRIVQRNVRLDGCFSSRRNPFCVLLDNVLDVEECQGIVAALEVDDGSKFQRALLNIGYGKQVLNEKVRKSSRQIIMDPVFANELLERIKHVLPKRQRYGEAGPPREPIRMNERLSCLRYDPGDVFRPHFDGSLVLSDSEKSQVTVQLYLNEDFEGGETAFLSKDLSLRIPIHPKTGSALLFEHRVLHEGCQVTKGRKYTIRTDVLY